WRGPATPPADLAHPASWSELEQPPPVLSVTACRARRGSGAAPPTVMFLPIVVISVFVVIAGGSIGLAVASLFSNGRDTKATAVARDPQRQRTLTQQRSGKGRSRGKGRKEKPLPADATVTFGTEREAAEIDDILSALDRDLVGLLPIKKKVQQIAALLLVDRARQKFGLEAPRPNLHMCFTGPPGTGKTPVALRIADLLHRLGYLEQGQLVHALRDDLVGQFIGHTAPRTKRPIDRAEG